MIKSFSLVISTAILTTAILFLSFIKNAFSYGSPADSVYQQAQVKIAQGDSPGALKLLDQAIKLDKKNYAAFLERGRLYLAQRNGKAAIDDFIKAIGAKDKETKVEAYLGLADTYLTFFKRKDQAITGRKAVVPSEIRP